MKTIAIDFDNTLFYDSPQGLKVTPGAAEALAQLQDMGFKVVIHTCRTGIAMEQGELGEEVSFIEHCLHKNKIPYDEIYLGEKLIADYYVDDRAVSFRGDWQHCVQEVSFRQTLKKAS